MLGPKLGYFRGLPVVVVTTGYIGKGKENAVCKLKISRVEVENNNEVITNKYELLPHFLPDASFYVKKMLHILKRRLEILSWSVSNDEITVDGQMIPKTSLIELLSYIIEINSSKKFTAITRQFPKRYSHVGANH